MSEHHKQPMGMPRSSLMTLAGDDREFIAVVAHALAITFTLLALAGALIFFPPILAAYTKAGVSKADLPFVAGVVQQLGWLGQIILIPLVNAIIYWLFFKQAKKMWAGLAFIPIIIYMMFGFFIVLAMIIPLIGII